MPSVTSLAQLKEHLCMREHLSKEECEHALLPSLEHASLVHSHLSHNAPTPSPDTFDQTRNAIVYISLVVVVYVMVILWLVSSNIRSMVTNARFSREEGSDTEALLTVVKHDSKKGKTKCKARNLYEMEERGVDAV